MVNTEEFTKRLNTIMEYHDLSAASFADKIDVGRSSISHLLSGRNKPSLDFVLKVVQAFPEVELYWLLNGKGTFPTTEKATTPSVKPSPPISPPDLFTQQQNASKDEIQQGKKEIQKVVIFYSDGTFEAYEN